MDLVNVANKVKQLRHQQNPRQLLRLHRKPHSQPRKKPLLPLFSKSLF